MLSLLLLTFRGLSNGRISRKPHPNSSFLNLDWAGNVQLDPTALWPDLGIMPKAAKTVVVTVEEIVDTDVLRRHPDRTVLPGFVVDAVVEVPFGAHPTSCFPHYGYDAALHRAWVAAARDDAETGRFLDRYIRTPETQADYLAAVGGAGTLLALEHWEHT